jgi:hypothetical protein
MGSRYLAKVVVAVLLLSLGLAFLSGQSTHVAATSTSDYCYYWYYDCSYYNSYYYGYYPNYYSSNYYYSSYCGGYSYYGYPYYGAYGYSSNY